MWWNYIGYGFFINKKDKCYIACYYFDDIIKLEDIDIDNFLIDKKSQENIFISDI